MRHRQMLLALVLGVTLAALGPLAAVAQPPARSFARDWIVVLKANTEHPSQVAADHARGGAATVRHVYDTALRGYAASMSKVALDRARSDARVAFIEPDHTAVAFHHRPDHQAGPGGGDGGGGDPPASCTDNETVPWGVERVGARANAGVGDGTCGNGPDGATIYVLDTGSTSKDLHVVDHRNYMWGPNKDCNGHGTHVAGTAAAIDNGTDVIGVAPGAPVVALKVLGCDGTGPYSGIIAAVDYVARLPVPNRVVNMSLGGPPSTALDNTIRDAVKKGVFFALAAGNSNANACNYSPARVGATIEGAVTVGATTRSDSKASFSNHGDCVELWAPGADIESLAVNGGTAITSGTSMATPHVAGGAALWLTNHNGGPVDVEKALLSEETSSTGLRLLNVSSY